MGSKKKAVEITDSEQKQTLLFFEEELSPDTSGEHTEKPGKNKRKSGMIPFFLHSSKERKKAQKKYIQDNFSDETYKFRYDTAQETADAVPENEAVAAAADTDSAAKDKHIPAEKLLVRKKTKAVLKTSKKKPSEKKSLSKTKKSDAVAKKCERLRKTKKKLLKEYTERYDSEVPEDIGMSSKEKKEFKREIDNINERIEQIERDDGEIEYIPTELKNTYTVFRDVAVKHKLLTADEEKELSKLIQEGDEEAFTKFVEANYRLVIACAKQIYSSRGKSSILDYMDIIQEGIMGLLIAVSKFDWRRGTRFSTYGVPWIYQRINRVTDSQRNGFSIPGYAGYCVRRMNEDIRKYQAGTLDETNMKQSELKRMKELSMISTPMIAIDPSSDPDDNQGTLSPELIASDSIRDDSAILGKIEEEQYQDRFHSVLKDILTSDEYDMLCQRHGMGEYAGVGTASLRLLAEPRRKSIECTRLQIEDIEKKIRRSTRIRCLNKEWFKDQLPVA